MNTINRNNTKSFSLKKNERLSSNKIIEKLFAEGDHIVQYPLKMVYLKTTLNTCYKAQAAFTVSKKNFKKATERNRIKRLLREAYRLNKHIIYDSPGNYQLAIFIIFLGNELPEFKAVELAMGKGLKKINPILTHQDSINRE